MPDDRLPAAVLWDMDGTLVDTEPYWIDSEYALAAEFGGTWSEEHALALVGSDLRVAGEYIRRHAGIDLSGPEIVERLMDDVIVRVAHEIPWRPGAAELLADLVAGGVPTALVTMSYRRLADPVIEALPANSFTITVAGDEVANGKPHPEPYLRAAELLGVRPEDCVAVEDSPTGVAAATAAGCRVIAVPHNAPVPPASTHIELPSLDGVRAADLWRLTQPPGA